MNYMVSASLGFPEQDKIVKGGSALRAIRGTDVSTSKDPFDMDGHWCSRMVIYRRRDWLHSDQLPMIAHHPDTDGQTT